MGLPLIFPTDEFLLDMHQKYDVLTQRTWTRANAGFPSIGSAIPGHENSTAPDPNNDIDPTAIKFWLQFAGVRRLNDVFSFF